MGVTSIQAWRNAGRRMGARRAVHAGARLLGYDLVKRHFYSSIPDLDALPPTVWARRSELAGLRYDVEAGLRFLESELAEFLREFTAPAEPTGRPGEFYLHNTFYEGLDAETLYAMVRRFAPQRVLELGSGFSTLIIGEARRRGAQGDRTTHRVFDPYARDDLRSAIRDVATLEFVSALDVPMSEFAALQAGDFLFVDTTHTVKIGSDVNRIVLDILPTLAPGVIVHFHDIFLPYEYPIEFYTEVGFSWAEQYLIQAFLAFNAEFEVLFGNAALQRDFPERVAELVPTAASSRRPAAFWIRRAGG